jgi:hypothetical protein
LDAGGTIEHVRLDSKSSRARIAVMDKELGWALRLADCQFIERGDTAFSVATREFCGYFTVALKTGKVTKTAALAPILSIASSGGYLAATSSCSTFVYVNDNCLVSVHQYSSVMTCSAVSDVFELVVVGLQGGRLVLFDLPSGIQILEIELEGVPQKVAISDGFGFIVVLTAESGEFRLRVYSNDGILVRKIAVAELAAWHLWAARGFDFMAFGTIKGELFVCEVFYLDARRVGNRAAEPIVTVKYLRERQMLCVAQKGRRIDLWPQSDFAEQRHIA